MLGLKNSSAVPKIKLFDVSKTDDTLILNITLENGDVFEGKFKRDYKIFYTRWIMGDVNAIYDMFVNIKKQGLDHIQQMLEYGYHCEKIGYLIQTLMICVNIPLEFQSLPATFSLNKI